MTINKEEILTIDEVEEMLNRAKNNYLKTEIHEPHKTARLEELSGAMKNFVEIIDKLSR